VFHFTLAPVADPREFRPIAETHVVDKGRQCGLLASPLRKVLSSIGAETSLDLLSALESTHFLLIEGPADALLLDHLLETGRLGQPRETAMYWSLQGIDEGVRSLRALKVVLSQIRNSQDLWSKARLILDSDLLTASHTQAIAAAYGRGLGLRVHFWDTYTAEAVLLSGGPRQTLASQIARAASMLPRLDPEKGCERAWERLGATLRERWMNSSHHRLDGQLTQRRKLLLMHAPDKTLSPVSKMVDEVLTFHKSAIGRGEYWHSATKEDVRQFVNNALVGMGSDQEDADDWCGGPNWFDALLQGVRSVQDFPALSSMLTEIRT
jgi:hypothetical protein